MAILGYNNGTQQSGWGTGSAYHAVKFTAFEDGSANTINVNLRSDDGNNHDYYLALYEYDSGLNEWNILDSAKTVNGGAGGSPTTLSSAITASLVNGNKYLIICKATTHAYQYVWDGSGSGPEEGAEDSSFSPGSTFPSNFSDTVLASNTGYTYDNWIDYTPSGGGTPANVNAGAIAVTVTLPAPVVTGKANVNAGAISITEVLPAPSVTGKANVNAGAIGITETLPAPTVTGKANVNVGAIGVSAGLPAAVVTGKANVNVGAIAISSTLPTPVLTGKANVSAGAIAINEVLPAPNVTGKANVNVGVIAINVTVPAPSISGAITYAGTLYKCIGGVLVLSDLPDWYNNRTITGKKLWYVKDGVRKLIHTASH